MSALDDIDIDTWRKTQKPPKKTLKPPQKSQISQKRKNPPKRKAKTITIDDLVASLIEKSKTTKINRYRKIGDLLEKENMAKNRNANFQAMKIIDALNMLAEIYDFVKKE
ncbi:hypothetical protein [Candidatus Harpocratesius sp.]